MVWTARLVIPLAVLAVAGVLSSLLRRRPAWGPAVRFSLGGFLAINELIWYDYRLHIDGFRFPDELPLQLCDFTLWLTVIAALTLKQGVYEVAYFFALGGTSMTLFTPDLGAVLLSYPAVKFFVSHGFVVLTALTLAGGRLLRLEPGCIWRAFAVLNTYAAGIGLFDAVFKTNYMYLCQKPGNASLLDYFGPWPVYIVAGEAFALILFWLLWLPFRPQTVTRTES